MGRLWHGLRDKLWRWRKASSSRTWLSASTVTPSTCQNDKTIRKSCGSQRCLNHLGITKSRSLCLRISRIPGPWYVSDADMKGTAVGMCRRLSLTSVTDVHRVNTDMSGQSKALQPPSPTCVALCSAWNLRPLIHQILRGLITARKARTAEEST